MQTFYVCPSIRAGKTWVEEYLSHEGKDTEAFNKTLALLWSSKRRVGEIGGVIPPKNMLSTLTTNCVGEVIMSLLKVQTVNSINGEIFSKVATLQGLSFYSDPENQRVAIVAEKNNEVLAMVILDPWCGEGGGGTLILQTGDDVGLPVLS